MTKLFSVALIATALIFVVCGPPPRREPPYGIFAGCVTDSQSAELVAGATIALVNTDMGAITAQDGCFKVLEVPAGTYTVRVSCITYEPVVLKSVNVYPESTTWRDIQLTPSPSDLPLTK